MFFFLIPLSFSVWFIFQSLELKHSKWVQVSFIHPLLCAILLTWKAYWWHVFILCNVIYSSLNHTSKWNHHGNSCLHFSCFYKCICSWRGTALCIYISIGNQLYIYLPSMFINYVSFIFYHDWCDRNHYAHIRVQSMQFPALV